MKQLINNVDLFAKRNIHEVMDKNVCHLFGVHADICASQKNEKYRKYFFDCEGHPLTWKLPAKAAFEDYHFNIWFYLHNEELA